MDTPEDVLRKARGLHGESHYQEAVSLYNEVIQLWDVEEVHELLQNEERQFRLARAYNDRGHCYYMLVEFDEAIKDLTQAIKLDPKLDAAYYTRGTIHYRLCNGQAVEDGGRLVTIRKALDDFHEAVNLKPVDRDFLEGLNVCKKKLVRLMNGVESKVLVLDGLNVGQLAHLMYLLDSGDPSMGSDNSQRRRNTLGARQGCHAFLSILSRQNWGSQYLSALLELRAQELLHRMSLQLPKNTEAYERHVQLCGEELLVLVEACHHLNITHRHLDTSIAKVQTMLRLTDSEKIGSFFLYAENLLLSRLCDNLTPLQVYKLYCAALINPEFCIVDGGFKVTENNVKDEEGLKEVLFFYLIRVLEFNSFLNRIYTDNLKSLLEDVVATYKEEDKEKEEEKQSLIKAMTVLQSYPNQCRPSGLCVVFCVTEGRPGAKYEMDKIKSVFQDKLGFTVITEPDPSNDTLEWYAKELQNTKYNFYDSFVFWFVSHGSEDTLTLADKKSYSRDTFIHKFSLPDNFRKKPKIFFMATCRGNKTIKVMPLGGVNVAADGRPKSWPDDVPLPNQDISSVYYQMDRVIANATLPEKYSFRTDDKGSIFVDTVCCLLEERCGQNLTVVLEEAFRRIHRVLFISDKGEFEGSAKQACFYESTLQKTLLIPDYT
ncbi:hypothetical protein Pmani_029227 [Petrolisthes manimaculis]|uniref:Caspase-8 n=1 Tax=Petrolisthes manimaculis TaxID=1843537 RepID=A0AAE1P0M8_9EUCA|nr:hypothetical protein Pmani_029227 [Petrolisthes manimaculis]